MRRRGEGELHQRGLTLVELMVALAIAFIVIGVVYQAFTSQQRTYTIQDQVAEAQQNARVAMNILMRDLRMAGFGRPEGDVIIRGDTYTQRSKTTQSTMVPPSSPWWGVSDLPRDTLPGPRMRVRPRSR
jgi:type IV pilus assembly protein PilW